MNVRYVKEWDDLLKALDDTDVPKDEYASTLAEMCEELVNRLEAARVELDEEFRNKG